MLTTHKRKAFIWEKRKTFNIIGFTYSHNDQTNGQCLSKCVLWELNYFMVHICSNCNPLAKGCKGHSVILLTSQGNFVNFDNSM